MISLLYEQSNAIPSTYAYGHVRHISWYPPPSIETILVRYGNGGGENPNVNPSNLPFYVVPDGKSYPYNPDMPDYLSKFPILLRGCG